MITKERASIDDLFKIDGKAEIVNGEIVLMAPAGSRHGRTSNRILRSLMDFEDDIGGGCAYGDNVGFIVDLPNRKSFSPDAAWMADLDDPDIPEFVDGAPSFAVEIRSPEDYGEEPRKRSPTRSMITSGPAPRLSGMWT